MIISNLLNSNFLAFQYGLYTAFAGPIVYALLGSVAQVTVGPTAVMALMTSEFVQIGGVPYAVVLSFLTGCIELLAGFLNLGIYPLKVLSNQLNKH